MIVDGKIVVEYDGSGHNMQVRMGTLTDGGLRQKDYSRDMLCKSIGYKVIRVESPKDILPAYTVLAESIQRLATEDFVRIVL